MLSQKRLKYFINFHLEVNNRIPLKIFFRLSSDEILLSNKCHINKVTSPNHPKLSVHLDYLILYSKRFKTKILLREFL